MENQTSKKVLVIEDEAPMSRLLGEALEEAGFVVLQADDGQTGLETALREHPDLILLDVILPELDGMTVMKRLRDDEWGKTARVILLTNLSANDQIMKGIVRDEPSFYLVKTNWTVQDVIDRVKQALDK